MEDFSGDAEKFYSDFYGGGGCCLDNSLPSKFEVENCYTYLNGLKLLTIF